ncbi:MAG TPA: 16S rRNA (adenine(1518)-N(6)/adenine(1519)-N(6))-dimethyltransferase RsmA [Candidatus Obscuribacterales bacterium]
MERRELVAIARRFQARRQLGQNFLTDPHVLERIAGTLDLSPSDSVLEIGPGLGFLTRFLTGSGAAVTAVELDASCVEHLRRLNLPGLRIVHADILQFDLGLIGARRLKVVGNIPYQITAPIIAHLFGEIDKPAAWLPLIDKVVMTVQLEVAERLVARAGEKQYSQVTLLTNYYCRACILEVVPAECFFPEPKVTSAVVELIPLAAPAVEAKNPRLLRQIIQAGFAQRRKMLKNNLGFLHLPEGQLLAVFSSLKLDPQIRAEKLSLGQFAMLADALETARPMAESRKDE